MIILRNYLTITNHNSQSFKKAFGKELHIILTNIIRKDIWINNLILLKIQDVSKSEVDYGEIKYYLSIGNAYGNTTLFNIEYNETHVLDEDCPIFKKNFNNNIEYMENYLIDQRISFITYVDILEEFSNVYFIFNKKFVGSFL
jgi:hypothetical protein